VIRRGDPCLNGSSLTLIKRSPRRPRHGRRADAHHKDKNWREVYPLHPAADVFPMLPDDQLNVVGVDPGVGELVEVALTWMRTVRSAALQTGQQPTPTIRWPCIRDCGCAAPVPVGSWHGLHIPEAPRARVDDDLAAALRAN
jgi:hypothetical protein